MFRSLRGRLIVLLVLLSAAALAAGVLMVGLFRQSATAQAGQAEAEIGRACDAIGGAFRNTHDRRVLTILADISRNTDEDGEVRAAALGAIRRINSQRF